MGNGAQPNAPALTAIVLRPANAADLPAIVALEGQCYADPWPASAFTSLPGHPRVFFHVAESQVERRVSGYVVAWYVLDEGELANLAVAADSRGRGVGGALLDAMLLDAQRRGTGQVYLEVRESNVAARQLYASRGFEAVGRRKQYYRTPSEDALILRRTIKPNLM